MWILAPALSFVDGEVVVATFGVYAAGIAAACCSGTCATSVRPGSAWRSSSSARRSSCHKPEHIAGDFVFIPGMFAIAWLAGYALRERTAQTEAAEERAARPSGSARRARLAVAEERARIARELHDVVAHAVSVMVLQVGAVRHHLPAELGEDRQALQGVEQTGRTALGEMRQLLGAMRERDDGASSPRSRGSTISTSCSTRSAGPAWRCGCTSTASRSRAARRRPVRLSHRAGGADEHAQARARRQADVDASRYGPTRCTSRCATTAWALRRPDGRGHGLVGVGERVKIYGGEMNAGPATGGGFVLPPRCRCGRA